MERDDVPKAKFYVIKPYLSFDNFDYITEFKNDLYVIKASEWGKCSLEVSKESENFESFKQFTHPKSHLPRVVKDFFVETKGPSRKLSLEEYLNLVGLGHLIPENSFVNNILHLFGLGHLNSKKIVEPKK